LPLPENQTMVSRLAPSLTFDVNLSRASFTGDRDSTNFSSRIEAAPIEKNVHVLLDAQGSTFSQAGTIHRAHLNRSQRFDVEFSEASNGLYQTDRILREFFPPGTLLLWNGYGNSGGWDPSANLEDHSRLAVFSGPQPEFDQPLDLETWFLVKWYQRDLALKLSLTEGAKASCDDARWEVLGITSTRGALTVDLRMETRDHWHDKNSQVILLHLPDQKVVRLEALTTRQLGERAEHTGWKHQQVALTWNHVFTHADGQPTGVDLSQARILLLRSRFLGQSQHHWRHPGIRLTDFAFEHDDSHHWMQGSTVYAGRSSEAFEERMATLQPPTAERSEQEARRYAYDLFSAAGATGAAEDFFAYPLIASAFAPLGHHHLPIMLDLRSEGWPGRPDGPPGNQLEHYLTDSHRQAVIDRAPNEEMLARLVVRKGWAEEAKRLKPGILSRPFLSEGAKTLFVAWKDDPECVSRLLQEVSTHHDPRIIEALDTLPELRPVVEATVRKQFAEFIPLVPAWKSGYQASLAADFGSPEAFALCLHWLSLVADITDQQNAYPRPRLLRADGRPLRNYDPVRNHERLPPSHPPSILQPQSRRFRV
jgi:hypothetical protein